MAGVSRTNSKPILMYIDRATVMIGLVWRAITGDASRQARLRHSSVSVWPAPKRLWSGSTTSIRMIGHPISKKGGFGHPGGDVRYRANNLVSELGEYDFCIFSKRRHSPGCAGHR